MIFNHFKEIKNLKDLSKAQIIIEEVEKLFVKSGIIINEDNKIVLESFQKKLIKEYITRHYEVKERLNPNVYSNYYSEDTYAKINKHPWEILLRENILHQWDEDLIHENRFERKIKINIKINVIDEIDTIQVGLSSFDKPNMFKDLGPPALKYKNSTQFTAQSTEDVKDYSIPFFLNKEPRILNKHESNIFLNKIKNSNIINNPNYIPITEGQLFKSALKVIQDYGNNGITTSELIKELRELLKPQGADTDLLKGRADDKFSQKVRNLKSHRKLDLNNNISFINNKYYWLKNNVQKIDPFRNLIIPEDIDWRKKHFISIVKEKIHTSGGKKAINQWEVLKKFDNLSIYNYQTEAMNNTMSDRTNSLYHNSRDGINWWDQELHFCVLKNIVLIKDSNEEIIKI